MSRHQALQERLTLIEAQVSLSFNRQVVPHPAAQPPGALRPRDLRQDAADPVSPVLQALLAEVLPGALMLDWRQEASGHAGRMVAEGLVYRFRVDGAGVGYRPAWEGVKQRGWELRSDSFLELRAPAARMDFRRSGAGAARGQKRKCMAGYSCGNACISLQKECRITPASAMGKARLRRLQQLAAGGDKAAEATASQVSASRGAAALERQKQRNTRRVEKLLARPEIAEFLRTGKLPQAASASTEPGTVREIKPGEVVFDPGRFQYKLNASAGTGEVGSLSGVRRWDPNLAGVMSVWKDPADNKVYVVNGHNRLSLARRLGAEAVTVRFLKAANATEARAIGALQNIAEGAGTPMDAAKFFRDTGIKSQADVEARGLPLGSGQAEKGLRLSKLPTEVFNAVVRGDLTVNRGAIIGGSGLDEAKQREVFKMIGNRKGIADQTLQELVEHAAASQQRTQTTMSLFGETQEAKDNLITRAKLSAALKSKIAREKRLFGTVSKAKAATSLTEKGGNVINQEQSAKVAGEASEALSVFERLKSSSGPISSALNRAADRVEAGESEVKVRQELERDVFAAVEEELVAVGLRKRPRADSLQQRIDLMEHRVQPRHRQGFGLSDAVQVNREDSGKGEACGNSWIDPNDTCRKENSGANTTKKGPKETLSEITKSRYADNTRTKRQVIGVVQLGEPVQIHQKYIDNKGEERDHYMKADDASYAVTAKYATSGSSDLKETVGRAIGIDLSESQTWVIGFETGLGSGPRGYSRIPHMPKEAAKRITTAIRIEIEQLISEMPDNTVITCNPWTEDGLGDKRRSIYERAGFYTYSEKGAMVALVREGRIVRPAGLRASRKDSVDGIDLERLIYQLLTIQAPAEPVGNSLRQRIDALRRRVEAPGQLGLSLGGSAPAISKGKGSGEPCGQGWISRTKECRKEGGGQPAPRREGSESERKPGAESGTSLAMRANEARRRLVSTLAEVGGLDENTADLVADYYLAKPKEGGIGAASLDPHIGQFSVKHGMFLDRSAINHAVSGAIQLKAGQQRVERRKSFLSGLSPMARGKAEKSLGVMVRNSRSGYVTRQELVEERVAEGFAPITTEKGERRLANRDGVFLTLRDVSAAGLDYAAHIIKSKQGQQAAAKTEPDTFTSDEAIALQVMANKKLRSDRSRDAEMLRLGVSPETDLLKLVHTAREKLGGPGWWQPGSGWKEKLNRFAAAAADPKNSVLTNPGRQDPGLAPKGKEQGLAAQEVSTSSQQAAFARQQQQAAKAAGDQRGAQAWRNEERTVERNRLANAISRSNQSQASLFGVTEYDETMPLFQQPGPAVKRRRDAASIEERIDAVKRKCATGYSCGASCISMSKQCRKTPSAGGGQQKMKRILALATPGRELPATADEPKTARIPSGQPMTREQITKAFAGYDADNITRESMQDLLGRIYEARGFNRKPDVVESETILRSRRDTLKESGDSESLVMYRGLTEASYAAQFKGEGKTGDRHYPGLGVYGNGSYAAAPRAARTASQRMAAKEKALRTAISYTGTKAKDTEGWSDKVVAIALKSEAKVLRAADQDPLRSMAKVNRDASAIAGFDVRDTGVAAAILGYDAYEVSVSKSQAYWVILNRGATVVSSVNGKK